MRPGTATERWDDWMQLYRHGVFVVLPPPAVARVVDAQRARFDPQSAEICGAYVTLSEPLASPLSDAQADEVADAMARVAPFTLRYGPLHTVEPHPGVVYAITPAEPFEALRDALAATSAFRGSRPVRGDVPAHMTVAEFVSVERSAEILEELAHRYMTGSFLCDTVTLIVPDSGFCFRAVRGFSLGGTGSRS